jgi:ADP-ribose pyrophosphatase YjhB (NUDIX family)
MSNGTVPLLHVDAIIFNEKDEVLLIRRGT